MVKDCPGLNENHDKPVLTEYTVGLDTSAIDGTFREHAIRGIGRYVGELHRYLSENQADNLKVSFFDHQDVKSARSIDALIEKLPAGRATLRAQVVHPLCLAGRKTKEFDAIHFPAHMDAPSWSIKPYIITVLDLIPLILSDMYKADRPSWKFNLARWLELRAIRSAQHIIAISEQTADDVHRILEIPREKITVTPLGVDESFFSAKLLEDEQSLRSRLGIACDRPIILYVGGIDQRKNYPKLLETLDLVRERSLEKGEQVPVLVMAGKIDQDRQYPKLLQIVKERKLEEDVFFTGFVSDTDLLQLLSISSVYLFLSLYEGFGLPPLEALAAGVPVVSSNTSAMPSVLGDAVAYVDPLDARSAATEVARIIGTPEERPRLSEKGKEQARKFNWTRTGELTLEAYEKMALGGRRRAVS